jgi:hypothetical protein
MHVGIKKGQEADFFVPTYQKGRQMTFQKM